MNNYSGTEFGNKAAGFDRPTQLPRDQVQNRDWQDANKRWWEATPMRYDWREEIPFAPDTREYFSEIDRRFLESARHFLRSRFVPFDDIIPFESLADKDVLEIGIGQGTHAQLIAPRCKSFTGIDLTAHATRQTARRFEVFRIPGIIRQMDAEDLDFPDASFDFIWSWGVIHHSANTRRILEQMARVLRPDGRAIVMVYHRSWWHFYVGGLLRGLFLNQFRAKKNFHHIAQASTDGAIARYYTPADWRQTTDGLFENKALRVYGLKAEVFPIPAGRLKDALERAVPDNLSRLITNGLRLGTFLVADMRPMSALLRRT